MRAGRLTRIRRCKIIMELDKTVRRNLSLPFKGEAFCRESLPGFYIALSFRVAYAGAD